MKSIDSGRKDCHLDDANRGKKEPGEPLFRLRGKPTLLFARAGLVILLSPALFFTNPGDLEAGGAFAGALVNVRDFGAKGDGVTDDTAVVQDALDAARRVFFPAGVYRVRSGRLQLKDDAALQGEGEATVIRAVRKRPDVQDNIIKAVGRHNITVDSLSFSGVDSKQAALLFASCSRVRVTHCRSRNCQLVYIGSAAVRRRHDINTPNGFFDVYDLVITADDYSSDILIDSNVCIGDLDADSPADGKNMSAIFVSFARDVRISNNSISRYYHGITFWGGNANTSGPVPNGDLANERKCRRIAITGNNIRSIRMGGIWGAMGRDVAVIGNTVTGCGDVGIDFEGCVNCTAAGNTVEDCHTACLCTCFDNRGVVFSGNACTQHTPGCFIVYVQNLHHSTGNQDVNFSGNVLVAARGVSPVVSQGVRRLLFQGNTLHNVSINLASLRAMHHTEIISGNTLHFDARARKPLAAVRVGGLAEGGSASVVGNVITASVSEPDGSCGIDVVVGGKGRRRYLVASNVISGWGAEDICIHGPPLSGGGGANTVKLSGNMFSGLRIDSSAANRIRILDESNTRTGPGAVLGP